MAAPRSPAAGWTKLPAEDAGELLERTAETSEGCWLPEVGVATDTPVQAVRPALTNAATAPEPATLDKKVVTVVALATVVVTVNATATLDCRRWRPTALVTPVMATEEVEIEKALAIACLNWEACRVPKVATE